MTSNNPEDIILVPFPFSDLSRNKRRPALVLAVAERWDEFICVMLTSSPHYYNEVIVSMWKEAGLPKPTVARIHRLFTIDAQSVVRGLTSSKRLPADFISSYKNLTKRPLSRSS